MVYVYGVVCVWVWCMCSVHGVCVCTGGMCVWPLCNGIGLEVRREAVHFHSTHFVSFELLLQTPVLMF